MQLLDLLAQNLEENGITTTIEKNSNDSDGISSSTLQYLVNGLIEKTSKKNGEWVVNDK